MENGEWKIELALPLAGIESRDVIHGVLIQVKRNQLVLSRSPQPASNIDVCYLTP